MNPIGFLPYYLVFEGNIGGKHSRKKTDSKKKNNVSINFLVLVTFFCSNAYKRPHRLLKECIMNLIDRESEASLCAGGKGVDVVYKLDAVGKGEAAVRA